MSTPKLKFKSTQDKEQWAKFAAAALTGLLAAETEDNRFNHRAEAAALAASTADFMLGELIERDKVGGGGRLS